MLLSPFSLLLPVFLFCLSPLPYCSLSIYFYHVCYVFFVFRTSNFVNPPLFLFFCFVLLSLFIILFLLFLSSSNNIQDKKFISDANILHKTKQKRLDCQAGKGWCQFHSGFLSAQPYCLLIEDSIALYFRLLYSLSFCLPSFCFLIFVFRLSFTFFCILLINICCFTYITIRSLLKCHKRFAN